jgi:hypothetical protein
MISCDAASPRFRLHAAGIHFLISAFVIGIAAAVVFLFWYPEPYAAISGGTHLFLILATVDLIIGPLATAVVSSPRKRRNEWYFDLGVIALLQTGALAYGVWTMAQARPVHLAFEIDRFRVVHAIDVPTELLTQAPAGLRTLSWTGPDLVAVRPFRNVQEETEATLLALQGVHLGARPDLWTSYDSTRAAVLFASKPAHLLLARRPDVAGIIEKLAAEAQLTKEDVRYLPLAGRQDFWTALLDPRDARLIGFLPVDGFDP